MRSALALVWILAAGCVVEHRGTDGGIDDGRVDAAVLPPCPLDGGFESFGDWATCGGGCTRVHQDGECPPGYICTCSGRCAWFAVFYPDAGGCGLDAGHFDGGSP
jgi:hypothetical protein